MKIFKVQYRFLSGGGWYDHVSGNGTKFYTSLGAARGAKTQFENRDRWYGDANRHEYRIQQAEVTEWEDI